MLTEALSLRMPSGVGPVTASAKPQMGVGTGQVVIATGKEISMKTRATNAGLNRLWPSPPKGILAMPIATKAPTTIIQIGRLAGTLKANNRPVTMAEPSLIVVGTFMIKR